MRIGMMSDLYKPYISGVTNHISLCKKYLERTGHEVFVFTFGDEDYEDDEPHVIRSPSLPLPIKYGDQEFNFGVRYSPQARRMLQSMDLIHTHHPFLSGALALRYGKPRGIPVVFTNHTRYDLYMQAMLPQIPDGVGRAFLDAYLPSFCRACDLVITPSAGVREVLRGFGVNGNVVVVPNGVELEPFRQISRTRDRTRVGFGSEDIVLIYVGRLGPEKNLPFLLRAFAGAVQAYDQLALVLVGDGPERDNLEDRVRHMGVQARVKFVGAVPYDQTPDYLGPADVFVTASLSEVHPLSVIEAMAAGLPVLGIQSPGVGDIVVDGVTGLLTGDDLAAFTARLVRLATDEEMRQRMGEAACQEAERYAIERTTHEMLEHYQKLVAGSRRRQRGLRGLVSRWFSPVRP